MIDIVGIGALVVGVLGMLAIIAIAFTEREGESSRVGWAAAMFLGGIALGGCAGIANGLHENAGWPVLLALATPIAGLALLVAWLIFAVRISRR